MLLRAGMKNARVNGIATIALLLVGSGCATMTPPATNSGPALSSNGVQVAVVRQLCAPTQFGSLSQWVDETVELQVRNGSPDAVIVHRDKIHLLGPDGGAYSSGAGAGDLLTVAKGETQTFELTFTSHGGLLCTQAMRLDATGAMTARESPVVLGPVAFVPSRGI
jgi:hypothetical protein